MVGRRAPDPNGDSRNHRGPALTGREIEVLRLAASGARNHEIAGRLAISERTVKAHLTSVYGKLDVGSRTAATAAAMQRGLL